MKRKKRGKKKSKKGICPKCGAKCNLTTHHILPKRFWHGSGNTLLICRDCHDKLETHIPWKPRLTKEEYLRIVNDFLKGGVYEEENRRQ
jgi:hypothetical protein